MSDPAKLKSAGSAPATSVARASRGRALERLSFQTLIGLLGAIAAILLVAPTAIVVVTSFTSGYSLKFPPPGYSWRWYEALWNDSPELIEAFLLSLKLAGTATVLSIVLAVAAALALARRREAWARTVEAVFLSPLMLPTLAIGLSLLMLFNLAGSGLSFGTLVIGHMAITAPYILRTTAASLSQLDGSLLECAGALGASRLHAFRTVTLPLIAPGIAAGAFIGFMYSFDNVTVSLFLSDARSEVLPLRMWHIIEGSLDVRAAAVSGVLVAATVVLMVVMERLAGISRHVK
ncbi:ABC transporter permease [Variovorax sp. OV700]|uniref:ABC transporter permease n=1 Tax=Variovorax sp. OV700 TaxID=1882826 RepID=UPI00088C7C32|nr:ABC transporter permease [Variovorax sp. OV700]SDH54351.1 putative spermidine/putrescine transport system permease protein [Variovorax sp. OV700]